MPSLRFCFRLFLAFILLCAFDASAAFDHTHAVWGALLKRHLVLGEGARSSRVDYTGMSRDRAQLGAYLKAVSDVTPAEYAGWQRAQKLAFLINAYNAFTVEKVLTRYPDLKSIRDFGTVIGNPWKDRFFALLGKPMHLDGLEHDTIRARGAFDDPRIHFAVVCASIGCPMLREEPYEASRLDRQLDEQVVRFLGDRTRNRFVDGRLEVSKLFDWYEKDFSAGLRGIKSVEQFLGMYGGLLADTPADRKLIEDGRVKVRYLDYDWALNDVKR
jgi:hypothetical protein